MKTLRFDNTLSIKLQSELMRHKSAFVKSKPFKPSKAKLITKLRSLRAGWISEKSESIIRLYQGAKCQLRETLEYGVAKGFLEVIQVGKYENFHFTDKGMAEIREALAMTTCAFSGRKCA